MSTAALSVEQPVYRRVLSAFIFAYICTLATTMSGMELFASVLVAAVIVGGVTGQVIYTRPPFAIPLLCFIAVAWTGTLVAREPLNLAIYDLQRMRFFVIYFFLFFALRATRGLPWEKYLAGIALLVAVYGTFQHFFPLDLFRPEGRKIILYAIQDLKIGPLVLGTFNHHLTFVNVYLFYACLFTGIGLTRERNASWYLALGLWLFLLCFWTQSRTGWVAIGTTLCVLGWTKSKKTFIAMLAGFALIVGILYRTDAGFRERFDRTVFRTDAHYSPQDRQRLWHANWEMFKTSPIVGIGYNNGERRAKEFVDKLYPNTRNFYGHAHSTLAQILSNTGLLGLLAYLYLWFTVFRRNLAWIRYATTQRERGIAIGLFAGFIGFHIQGLTQWNFGDAEVLHNLIFFWAVVAASAPALKNTATTRPESHL